MNGAQEVKSPKALHPAFYGCFDWHSSVHGHWMLVRLLRTHPDMAKAAEIRGVLDENLTPDRIAAEVAYFDQPGRRSFERTYGWAWLLKLAAELKAWDVPEARRWSAGAAAAGRPGVRGLSGFPAEADLPHPHRGASQFGFQPRPGAGLCADAKDTRLEAAILDRAQAGSARDRRGPLAWEPGGEDFLSPCLEEAALMARLLPRDRFGRWLDGFLPSLPGTLAPATVSDRTDPKIVHLDGLNLSRARALDDLARTFGLRDPRRTALIRCGDRHARASLPHLATGSYEGNIG